MAIGIVLMEMCQQCHRQSYSLLPRKPWSKHTAARPLMRERVEAGAHRAAACSFCLQQARWIAAEEVCRRYTAVYSSSRAPDVSPGAVTPPARCRGAPVMRRVWQRSRRFSVPYAMSPAPLFEECLHHSPYARPPAQRVKDADRAHRFPVDQEIDVHGEVPSLSLPAAGVGR